MWTARTAIKTLIPTYIVLVYTIFVIIEITSMFVFIQGIILSESVSFYAPAHDRNPPIQPNTKIHRNNCMCVALASIDIRAKIHPSPHCESTTSLLLLLYI